MTMHLVSLLTRFVDSWFISLRQMVVVNADEGIVKPV
jgi:hypothetical protein